MYSQVLPSGKYRFFESYVDPLTRVRKTTSVTLDKDTRTSRKRAQTLLSDRIAKLTAGAGDCSGMTLEALLDAYEAAKRPAIREQTLIRNMITLRKCIEMFPEGTFADRLNARTISEAFSAWDVPNVTKNERLKRLKAFLRWAYRFDYVPDVSYLDKIPLYPDDKKGRREHKYLERDELEKVIESADPAYAPLIAFMALSGVRAGEALALTPEDVTEDMIRVNKTFSPLTGRTGPTKTDGSTREVYIQKELAPLLDTLDRSGPYLFMKDGHQIQYYAFNKYFKELTARVTGRELTTHALRHTHVSLLAGAGVQFDIVSRRLGHVGSAVTREIYFHVTQELKDRDKAALDGLTLLE